MTGSRNIGSLDCLNIWTNVIFRVPSSYQSLTKFPWRYILISILLSNSYWRNGSLHSKLVEICSRFLETGWEDLFHRIETFIQRFSHIYLTVLSLQFIVDSRNIGNICYRFSVHCLRMSGNNFLSFLFVYYIAKDLFVKILLSRI